MSMDGTDAIRALELEHELEHAVFRLRLALGEPLCRLMREKRYHGSYQICDLTRVRPTVTRAVEVILGRNKADSPRSDLAHRLHQRYD